jgi:hypothetical protein
VNDLLAIQERIRALLPRDGALSDAFTEAKGTPEISVEALDVLGKMTLQTQALRQKGLESGTEHRAFERAVAELGRNVEQLEALVNDEQCPPFAYVTWAWRVAEGLADYARAARAPEAPLGPSTPPVESGAPPLRSPKALLPPLSLGSRLRVNPVGPLLDLAAKETGFVQRRRRLLEAARRSLLETQAAVELPASEVQDRLLYITEQVRTLNALQRAGLKPTVDLGQQLKQAIGRRDAALVSSCLFALRHFSNSGGGPEPLKRLAGLTRAYLPNSVARSAKEVSDADAHPPGVLQAVKRGIEAARTARRGAKGGAVQEQLVAQALGSTALAQLVSGAAAVDGCFELGRSVAPVRASEEQARLRPVPFPTQTMVLRPAETVQEIGSSLFGDPRLLLLDFATGRLLTRTYLGTPRAAPSSAERVSEARYYLLDGSDSMLGRRGLLRDSLLLSELSSLIEFLSSPGAAPVVPVVYYRYFAKRAEPTRRVATREEALQAIEDCLGRVRGGGTDIEAALLSSLEEIRRERERDETLKRVQIVLVSDGVARVNLEKIWEARQRLGEIAVGVSVVALGSENEALKRLAALQRKAGQEVFYHFLPDHSVRKLIEPAPPQTPGLTEREPPRAGVAPSEPPAETPSEVAAPNDEARWRELSGLADEWLALESRADLEAIEASKTLVESLAEVGLSLERDFCDSQRARHESLNRDERVLRRRFDRWFPPLTPLESPAKDPAKSEEPLATIEALLATVVDVTDLLDGSALQRRYDAIEVFERLLLEAGIPPWRYARSLDERSPEADAAIREIRRVAALRD